MSVLTYECKNVAFVNYITPPEILEKYLPAHTKLDYYNGHCMISLVGFTFEDLEVKNIKIPLLSSFEQIALQFYVRRFDGASWRKGIVYISQFADKPVLSALAKSIFKEKFSTTKTSGDYSEGDDIQAVKYRWMLRDEWQSFKISSEKNAVLTKKDSEEEYLLEREYIYGKFDEAKTNEYKITHPRWRIFPSKDHIVDVDFTMQFGAEFSHLTKPHSVIIADGSKFTIENHSYVE